MRLHHFLPALVMGVLILGAHRDAWSQTCLILPSGAKDMCSMSLQKSCQRASCCAKQTRCARPLLRIFAGRGRCGRCGLIRPHLLSELAGRFESLLQRVFVCHRCDGKSHCCQGSVIPYDGDLAAPQPLPDMESEPLRDGDPFEDDELEAPPVPAEEAGYRMGKPVMVRRGTDEATRARRSSGSPHRFQPVNPSPLDKLIPIPASRRGDRTTSSEVGARPWSRALACAG